MTVCALIPAAGKARRLAVDVPKILVPITAQETIWSVLYGLLSPLVDQIHVVLSEFAQEPFLAALSQSDCAIPVSTSIQLIPTGMGDAIFGAAEYWTKFDTVLIVWGDQVNLSRETIDAVLQSARHHEGMILPLTEAADPYVQYMVTDGTLIDVRQTREGAKTDPGGLSDVGLFAFSVKGLQIEWQKYLSVIKPGEATGEINFLPFLTHLSMQAHWPLHIVPVEDSEEARGVNTPEDLAFAKSRFKR